MDSFTGTSGGRDKIVRGDSFAEPCTVEAKMVQGEVSACAVGAKVGTIRGGVQLGKSGERIG